jgi:uncharacterized delta-60 repeat protein
VSERHSLANVPVFGLLAAALLLALLAPSLAQAARAGSLDPSFGDAGRVKTGFCAHARSFAVAIDHHGRIVAAGTNNHEDDFCLIRYKPNGRLDRSFGNGGVVVTDFGDSNDGADAVAIDPRGRIVAAGGIKRQGSKRAFALARYKPNGSLDPSFGSGGTVTTPFASRAFAGSVSVDRHGRIVAVGASGADLALARYRSDGSLDPLFGSGGTLTASVEHTYVYSSAGTIDRHGRIVVAVNGFNGLRPEAFALFRYHSDGSLDPSFGDGGEVTTKFGGHAYAVATAPHGRIVAAGYSSTRRRHPLEFALARYKPNGSLDRRFSRDGKARTPIGKHAVADSVTLDSRRRIVAVGSSWKDDSGDTVRFALARYHRNGDLDRSFSHNGKVRTDIRAGVSSATIDSRDRIVVAGAHSELTIARFIGYRRQ